MMSDALAGLRLQIEWGADEALGDVPLDRFTPAAPAPPPPPRRAPAALAAPQAGTLDALYAELAAFDGCALRATAMHTVRPDGNPAAGVVVVGEAPGSDDDRSGRAFTGPSGALLDRVFGSAGMDRSGMLLTTLVPWRPPGGRKLADSEVQACLPFLLRLLALARPRRLVLLGSGPVRTLAGTDEPVRRLRGRWLDVTVPEMSTPVPAVALPPLDQWMRNAATKQEVWSQVLLLRRAISST